MKQYLFCDDVFHSVLILFQENISIVCRRSIELTVAPEREDQITYHYLFLVVFKNSLIVKYVFIFITIDSSFQTKKQHGVFIV